MCLLFVIILALLQFRVIQDSYLLSLCYGVLLAATIMCVMSMPALNKYIPLDTKEVSVRFWAHSMRAYDSIDAIMWLLLYILFGFAGFVWSRLASDLYRICYLCSNAPSNMGGDYFWHPIAQHSHWPIHISNAHGTASLLRLQSIVGKLDHIYRR